MLVTRNRLLVLRRLIGVLAVIEALSIIPLSYALPHSRAALMIAMSVLLALAAVVPSSIESPRSVLSLQLITLGIGFAAAWLVLSGGTQVSSWTVVSLIVLSHGGLLVLGHRRLPAGNARARFLAIVVAVAAVLLASHLIEPLRFSLSPDSLVSPGHFRMGLRFLFTGPLGLVAVVFSAGLVGWSRPLKAMAGICAAQYGMGLLELGVQLERAAISDAGAVLIVAFFVHALILLFARRRREDERRSAA